MTDQLRFGIIGTGRMASRMMQALAKIPEVSVTAVASDDMSRAQEFAEAYEIPTYYTSASDLAKDTHVDAIYICSRTANHVNDAIDVIKIDKPTLLEKPMATCLADATKLIQAAQQNNTLLVENLWCLALPSYRHVFELLANQNYGKPVQFQFSFGYPMSNINYPSIFDPKDGGALLDRGVYGVSLAMKLLGPVKNVKASAQLDINGIDLTTDIGLEHLCGATSQITVSLNALMSNTATLSCTHGSMQLGTPIVGSEYFIGRQKPPDAGNEPKSTIHMPNNSLKTRLRSNASLRRIKRLTELGAAQFISYGVDQYVPMLVHFIKMIRDGQTESKLIPLKLSLSVQEVLDQARLEYMKK